MTKTLLPPPQLEEILVVLSRRPQGADIMQIIDSLENPPHRWTIQRRLTELVARKHI